MTTLLPAGLAWGSREPSREQNVTSTEDEEDEFESFRKSKRAIFWVNFAFSVIGNSTACEAVPRANEEVRTFLRSPAGDKVQRELDGATYNENGLLCWGADGRHCQAQQTPAKQRMEGTRGLRRQLRSNNYRLVFNIIAVRGLMLTAQVTTSSTTIITSFNS